MADLPAKPAPGTAPRPAPEDFLLGTPAEHDVNQQTVAGQIMASTGFQVPNLPPHATSGPHVVSQRQFESFILALLGGLTDRLAASRSGIPVKTLTKYLQKGARGEAAGLSDHFTVFFKFRNIAVSLRAEWLLHRHDQLIRETKDPRLLLQALKRAGLEDELPDAEDDVGAQSDLIDALIATAPKVQ